MTTEEDGGRNMREIRIGAPHGLQQWYVYPTCAVSPRSCCRPPGVSSFVKVGTKTWRRAKPYSHYSNSLTSPSSLPHCVPPDPLPTPAPRTWRCPWTALHAGPDILQCLHRHRDNEESHYRYACNALSSRNARGVSYVDLLSVFTRRIVTSPSLAVEEPSLPYNNHTH